jgi:lipopolysaccharide/colanic/teichoic acid biosynthesis glycosyltransferase
MRNALDRIVCLCGLLTLAPLLAVVAVLVRGEDGGPVLFRQVRIGRRGRPFELLKFRTMRTSNQGPEITAAGDGRITRIGRKLRGTKLDELPQLWNVVRGDMSLVGPRPEVSRYVVPDSAVWQRVLSVRPGITDLATLVFRNEEVLLGQAEDPERFYRETVLPEKLELNLTYLQRSTPFRDLRLILLTLRYSFFPHGFEPEAIKRQLTA